MMALRSSLLLGCAAAFAAAGDVPCPSESSFPWCNTKLPRAERVATYVPSAAAAWLRRCLRLAVRRLLG